MSNSDVKAIQLAFGWPAYAGPANEKNGPAGYYQIRAFVKEVCHYNGWFSLDMLVESGGWDSIVARITHHASFAPIPPGGAAHYPRPTHPNPWTAKQLGHMVAFIKGVIRVSNSNAIIKC